MSDPLALVRWWAAVSAQYPRSADAAVLRLSLIGRVFEVRAGDLTAACRILESCVPSGRTDNPEPPPDKFDDN